MIDRKSVDSFPEERKWLNKMIYKKIFKVQVNYKFLINFEAILLCT